MASSFTYGLGGYVDFEPEWRPGYGYVHGEKPPHVEAIELGYQGKQGIHVTGLRYRSCLRRGPECVECSAEDIAAGR